MGCILNIEDIKCRAYCANIDQIPIPALVSILLLSFTCSSSLVIASLPSLLSMVPGGLSVSYPPPLTQRQAKSWSSFLKLDFRRGHQISHCVFTGRPPQGKPATANTSHRHNTSPPSTHHSYSKFYLKSEL